MSASRSAASPDRSSTLPECNSSLHPGQSQNAKVAELTQIGQYTYPEQMRPSR
jgi:hypothetical protein